MIKTRLFILFLSLGVIFPLLSQTADDAEDIANIQWETKDIRTGVKLKKCEAVTLYNSLQSIVIVEIDTAAVDFQYLLDTSVGADYMPVSAFAERNKAIVAINGTYFYSTGASQHFIKIDDKVLFGTASAEFDTRASGVYTVTDGQVAISTWNREKEAEEAGDAQYALVCGPVLIIDGEFLDLWDGQYITLDRHPRSCVGITDDGKLLIVAVDGRQTSRAAGMDLYELRFFMSEMGCVDAMNLDGGGSTALYVRGEDKLGIVNVPIDGNVSGQERNVGNILYVTEPSSPKPFIVTNPAPGGITGMSMWVKANGLVTKDENDVLTSPYVHDRTGFNLFDMETAREDASIQWKADQINSYPTIAFDSASVLKSQRKVKYTTFFSVNTLNKNAALLGFDEFGSSYTKLRYFLMTDNNNVYVHDGSSGSSGTNYNLIPYQNEFDERLNIFGASYGKTADDLIVNGVNQKASASNFCTRNYINAYAQIGARNSYPSYPTTNSHYLRGELAEVIAYPDTLTANKQNRVESYLAVKYGITIANPKFRYTSSYGDFWWNGNTSSYTPYSYYVTCITRDDKSELYHPVSKGNGNHELPSSGALLTLIHGDDPENPAPIDNQYFLSAGSNLDDLSLRNSIATEDFNYQIMQRHWKLNTDGTSQAFSVIIDIPEAQKAHINENSVGVILKNNNSITYVGGTLNSEKNQLTVTNLTAAKGDLLYLVLSKSDLSGITETTPEKDINIYYKIDQRKLFVNSFINSPMYCDVFSITGKKVVSLSFDGFLEHSIENVASGMYIVQVKTGNNQILKIQKIVITN